MLDKSSGRIEEAKAGRACDQVGRVGFRLQVRVKRLAVLLELARWTISIEKKKCDRDSLRAARESTFVQATNWI